MPDNNGNNQNNNDDDEYEKYCYLCRRPESEAGPFIRMPGNIDRKSVSTPSTTERCSF